MLKKKLLSIVLALALFASLVPASAVAEKSVTAYVTICAEGSFVKDKNGSQVVQSAITVPEGSSIDAVLKAAHDSLYSGGSEAGYKSVEGAYGKSLVTLWGDNSGCFGYYLNNASAWSLNDKVSDGDRITAFVYQDKENWSDMFTFFNVSERKAVAGEAFTLTLSGLTYDEAWNLVTVPISGAAITEFDYVTTAVTDAEGKALITLGKPGRYIVSAKSSGAAIVPPSCVVTVSDTTLLDERIEAAAAYIAGTAASPATGAAGNDWAIFALARSGHEFSEGYIAAYYKSVADLLAANAGKLDSTKATDYARTVIALTAAGYDASDIEGIDLTLPLVDYEKVVSQGVTSAAYALLALDTADYTIPTISGTGTQATREKYIDYILSRQLDNGGFVLSGTNADPDTTAIVLQALAGYTDDAKVAAAVAAAVSRLSAMQNSDGTYTSWGNTTAESSAQVITALCELGISPLDERFVKNGHNLFDALSKFALSGGAYSSTIGGAAARTATEQSLYALAAYHRFLAGSSTIYTIDGVTKATGSSGSGLPGKDAAVTVRPVTEPGKTFADITGHANQAAVEALAERGIINGKTANSYDPDATMTRAEFAAIIVRGLGLEMGTSNVFGDVPASAWFSGYVASAYNFGIINGVSPTRFAPQSKITREQAATMIARAAKLCGMDTDYSETEIVASLSQFSDYTRVSSWARSALAFCYDNGILDDSAMTIAPTAYILRGELAEILYQMLDGANLLNS